MSTAQSGCDRDGASGFAVLFADDLAEQIAREVEDGRRSPEEVLLASIDSTEDGKLTGFALRFALSSHVRIPDDGKIDCFAEAEAVFAFVQPKTAGTRKKAPAPIKAVSKRPKLRRRPRLNSRAGARPAPASSAAKKG